MEPLEIILIVLAVAGIWVLVEVALTNRKTRSAITELTDSVNNTLNEVNPVIAKVDGLIDEIQPSVKRIDPLLISTISAVDSLSKDLDSVDVILGDLSRTTTGIANASDTVVNGVNNTVGAASGFVGNLVGKVSGQERGKKKSLVSGIAKQKKIAEKVDEVPPAATSSDEGYYSFPTASSSKDVASANAGANAAPSASTNPNER